jgi:hypothetical protein
VQPFLKEKELSEDVISFLLRRSLEEEEGVSITDFIATATKNMEKK